MSNLSYFLADNVQKEEVVKYAASKRFKDENENAVEWELGCITSEEDEKLRKSCTKKVQVP
ncbi:phage tail assembly chaperone, partial [Clostridium neonatale]